MLRLTGNPSEKDFLNAVIEKSGENLLECLQCGKCTAGCPIASADVGGPRQLIAAILMGMKERVFQDPTWAYCVSCGTCAGRCPVEINMYQVSTALSELAEKEGLGLPEPAIHLFEELFLNSVRKYGRVQELRTVMAFNMRTFQPFKDMGPGISLMKKGAISPFDILKGIKKKKTMATIFSKALNTGDGE